MISDLVFQLFGLFHDHFFEAEDRSLWIVEGHSFGLGRRIELSRILHGHRSTAELQLLAGGAEISTLSPDLKKRNFIYEYVIVANGF